MAKVYEKIAAVQADLAKTGIAKSRRNSGQGYDFRGIDEVYAALSPLLAAHGLCILPRIISRECVERQTAKGGALFNVTVEAEFDFVAAEDGSIHVVKTFGEAMDSADKATNKAMSAAYKYAALMAFAIPTEGDNDADAVTHEVAPAQALPAGPINDSTRDWLSSKIDSRLIPVGEFCKAWGVTSLKSITYEQLDAVKAWLRDYKKEAA